MLSPEEAVSLAIDVARRGLAAGEMPIGAVVLLGDTIVSEAYTQELLLKRRVVHADLLAIEKADEALGFTPRTERLTLAVNLEPCLMCLGAAITLGVERVVYALESPNDGGHALVDTWEPPVEQPFFRRPATVSGGHLREESRRLFRAYARGDGPAGMRTWAAGLGGL